MRQAHRAGEKLYCGPTVPTINQVTGEIRHAQMFVAVLGAFSYTYAEALLDPGRAHAQAPPAPPLPAALPRFSSQLPMLTLPETLDDLPSQPTPSQRKLGQ